MKRQYFGTDGIRGRVGQDPVTPKIMLQIGWAAGQVFSRYGHGRVIIGKDTRISGYLLESALEAGLSAAGMDVSLTGPLPTPGVAYLTRVSQAKAGIMISASHNPYQDNGIKFFSEDGCKLPDSVELEIEALIDKPLATVEPDQLGKAERYPDPLLAYQTYCRSLLSDDFSLSGVTLVVDCANGAAYEIAPSLLCELGATVIKTGADPDGLNINRDRGSTSPHHVADLVRKHKADLGIAFDGDADRVILADESGSLVDGDGILYILSQSGCRNGTSSDQGVVGTLMSNYGLEKACLESGIGFTRSAVGDRYVLEELQRTGWCLGGESSGHIIQTQKSTTGDGLVSALSVLEVMVEEGRSVKELVSGLEVFPQMMINVKVNSGSPGATAIIDSPTVKNAVERVEKQIAGEGRVVLRASGTEPVIRVMVEGRKQKEVSELADQLAAAVDSASSTSPS
mgnify:CR=1 FL=1